MLFQSVLKYSRARARNAWPWPRRLNDVNWVLEAREPEQPYSRDKNLFFAVTVVFTWQECFSKK